MSSQAPIPNEHLRRARLVKGWSQAELAEQVGTSFEMVSRWERGITFPSPRYRRLLCEALEQTAKELGLIPDVKQSLQQPAPPFVVLASSYKGAEQPVIVHLKAALHTHGVTLWSPRQPEKQELMALHESVQAAQAVAVLLSPETRTSRQVQTVLELARMYHRPVCGIWIEGASWQTYIADTGLELAATFDARQADNSTLIEEIAAKLKDMGASHVTEPLVTPPSEPSIVPEPPSPTPPGIPVHKKNIFTRKTALLVGATLLILVGGLFGSLGLHSYLLASSAHSTAPVITRGGTWTSDLNNDPDSLIPNAQIGNGTGSGDAASEIDQALYLPLFYGDAQGVIHALAAREVPTLQNGEVNANATMWTFRLRPHLVWSDGQPYDARDVDYTWRLRLNPAFSASNTTGLNLISSADVLPDHLSITFHLKQPFAPFLAEAWVDGFNAPLPAHRFRSMTPTAILQSPDNLNPRVTSGPFLMSESLPGSHYTVVRNPRYYRASAGLPYLDKVTFLVKQYPLDALLSQVQQGTLDSTTYTSIPTSAVQKDSHVLISAPPTDAFEALYFNFHNTILSTHLEVRQAIAMAVDQQTLVNTVLKGIANPLCTDHPPMYHPGYEPLPPCPLFNLDAARKLLDDNGWKQGPDGVRAKNRQRLEFEYSTALSVQVWRLGIEQVLQSDLRQIGIKIDIQNYPPDVFFGPFLLKASTSPPTGEIAGRYDIAEFANTLSYDPNDSSLLACHLTPPNPSFYCNHELDALYMQEVATADPGVRQEIFVKIHRIYLTDFPFVVLASPFLTALSKKERIHNFEPGPFVVNTNIWEWWCDQGKC